MTILAGPEATQEYASRWADDCRGGDVFALYGPLGSGKTQLVKGLAKSLQFHGDVTSPTYSLIHEYLGGRLPIYHLDMYRLETVEQALRLGIEDYLPSDGVTMIEWPERIAGLLPARTRHIELEVVSLNERSLVEH